MKTMRLLLRTLVLAWLTAGTCQAFYNPEQGRWLSRDPIGEFGGREAGQQTRIGPVALAESSPREPNLHGFCRDDGVNRWDKLGLFGPINYCVPGYNCPPDYRPLPYTPTPCEQAIFDAMNMMGTIVNDARAHCVASCEIGKACGRWKCRCLGNLKEARDLFAGGLEWTCSWVLPKRAEAWLHDSIQGGDTDESAKDFEANEWGLDIAKKGGSCVKECEARYGPEP